MWYATFDQPWGQMGSGVFIRGKNNPFVQSSLKKIKAPEWFWLLLPARVLLWRSTNLFLVCVLKLCPVRFEPVGCVCVWWRWPGPPEQVLSHKRRLFTVGARFLCAAECFLASEFQMSASSCHRLLPDLIRILGRRDFGWGRAAFSATQTDVDTWRRTSF